MNVDINLLITESFLNDGLLSNYAIIIIIYLNYNLAS